MLKIELIERDKSNQQEPVEHSQTGLNKKGRIAGNPTASGA
jgi:hypothetical protein